MTREEILSLLNSVEYCFLATVEDGEPRVRGMALYRADEQGILFHSGEGKDMVLQLREHPSAEICAFDPQSGTQVRVRGTVEFLDDQALKEEMVATRPYLKQIVDIIGYDKLAVFRVKDCVASVWTMGTNLEPTTWTNL